VQRLLLFRPLGGALILVFYAVTIATAGIGRSEVAHVGRGSHSLGDAVQRVEAQQPACDKQLL